MELSGINGMLANWSEVNRKVVKFRYEWKLTNFPSVPENDQCTLDTISSEDPEIGDKWDVVIQRVRDSDLRWGLIFHVLQSDVPLKTPILVKFRFIIPTDGVESCLTEEIDESKETFCGIKNTKKSIFRTFVHKIFDYKANGGIFIACEMSLVTNPLNMNWHIKKNNEMMFHTLENDLSHDMGQLFINQKFGDFTFHLGDKQLRASKNILAARSTVFAAMFDRESNFRENRENHTDVRYIDYEIFKEMLFYIYTGRVSKLHEMTVDEMTKLLAAADRYQLENLKGICEEALLKIISLDNALDIFGISVEYNCSQLKVQTVEYIKHNRNKKRIVDAIKGLETTNRALKEDIELSIDERIPLHLENITTKISVLIYEDDGIGCFYTHEIYSSI